MIKPKKLEPGATLGLVAASGAFIRTKFKKGCQFLESKGYKLQIGKNAFNKYGYLAGKDEERAKDINDMFENSSVDAVMCIRGGYGASRILDLLDYNLIKENPKIFIGFSDPTALQLAIYKKSKLMTFYGPMLSFDFGDSVSPFTWSSFLDVLTCSNGKIIHDFMKTEYYTVLNEGNAHGTLIGGCISLIQTLIGTDYMPDFKDKILFLEDSGEYPYRLDRIFFHLKNAGLFEGLAGVIIGNTNIPRKISKKDLKVDEILKDVFKEYDYPVIYNLPFGHCKDKLTIPQGIEGYISTSEKLIKYDVSVVD